MRTPRIRPVVRASKQRAVQPPAPAKRRPERKRKVIIAADFDHTIHNPEDRDEGQRMGRPYPGAREALQRFRDMGAEIIIHTCRARPGTEIIDGVEYTDSSKHVRDWLDYFEIPYDDVTAWKPLASAYIDDKAVSFDGDWERTALEALALCFIEERS